MSLVLSRTICNISTTVALCFIGSQIQAADPVNIGGSNYAWYNIDSSVISNNQQRNCREQFGIIANYHQQNVRNTVKQQLKTMFNNGQRKLRVPIFHSNDQTTGTVLKSTGGNLSGRDRGNLKNFLADIKAAGFNEILVGFFPVSKSNPHNWYREFGTNDTTNKTRYYNSAMLQENWNLIKNLRPIITSANINYKIDLRNEGAAASNQWVARQYASELWAYYNAAYGKSDTIGFSVATGSKAEAANPDRSVIGNLAVDRYTTMKRVYNESGYGAPNIWDFHFYSDLDRKFAKLDAAMIANNDNTNIMIGETHYQDTTTLSHIQNIRTSRKILAIYAWPVTTSARCDGHVDVPYPAQYLYKPRQTSATVELPARTPTVQQPSTPVVQSQSNTPQSIALCTLANSDPDGDGWGWENQASCRVNTTSSTIVTTTQSNTANTGTPICRSASSDSDGDGWGWENQTSCMVR